MQLSTAKFSPLKGYENFEATTQIIIREILERGLEFEVLDAGNNLLVVKHKGKEFTILEGTISDANSIIAYWISNDKWMTRQFLKRANICQAKGFLLQKEADAENINNFSCKYVVKPADTDHGIGVSANIQSKTELQSAISIAFKHSKRVIVEEFFEGREYRFLVVEGKVIAIAYREPANIIGDGKSTIQQLIDAKNNNRGNDYRHPLLKIHIDEEVRRHLLNEQLTLTNVLPNNKKIYLRSNSNLSTGGDSIDVTDEMPSFYKQIAEKAANAAQLNIAGIDIIIDNLQAEPSPEHYIVVELNAPPMLSMHNYPYVGKNRHVERYVLDAILKSK